VEELLAKVDTSVELEIIAFAARPITAIAQHSKTLLTPRDDAILMINTHIGQVSASARGRVS